MPETDKVNILLVDDLPDKLLVLETVLADLHQNIVRARSGPEALQAVLKQDFAVILMDVEMPGMDGLETAALIRQRKKSSLTPIIFVTAYADDLRTTQGYSLGAVDYMLSPVVPEVLRSKVKVFTDLYRMTREVERHAEQKVALAREQAAREEAERSSRAIRESEERFRLASQAVSGFIYELDPATGETTVSPGITELLGFAPAEATRLEWWEGRVHPDDRARVGETLRTPSDSGRYRCQYRVRHRDGQYVFVWDQGLLVCDDRGEVRKLVGNVVDVTEQKKAEQALAEANRRKDEFLSMLAHELRNPLAPIRNALEVMRWCPPDDPRVEQTRAMIDRNVARLSRLVDDLLDVSRITLGKIRLTLDQVRLGAVVQEAIEISMPLIEGRSQRLTVRIAPEPIHVRGDTTRLIQVTANLLNNASKYTDHGGEIWVELGRDGADAVLRVRDNGIGIDPAMIESVFDPFTQADNSLARSDGGLGIGLTVVKRIVELHGGRVGASSTGIGGGSEFTIRLPTVLVEAIDTPAPPKKDSVLANGPTRRVLVVDDNVDAANSLALLMRLDGHDVRVSHEGRSALEMHDRFHPDVVVLDIGLPEMDGYEVARRLRGKADSGDPLLIALTGYGQSADILRSRAAGFDHHLVKPVDPQTVRKLLGRAGVTRANGY
jgi:PAS domain S-box-containing protein